MINLIANMYTTTPALYTQPIATSDGFTNLWLIFSLIIVVEKSLTLACALYKIRRKKIHLISTTNLSVSRQLIQRLFYFTKLTTALLTVKNNN